MDEIVVYQIHISLKDLPLEIQEQLILAALSKVIPINDDLMKRIVTKTVIDKKNHRGDPTSNLFTTNIPPYQPKTTEFHINFGTEEG